VGILIYFKHGGYSTEDDGQASSWFSQWDGIIKTGSWGQFVQPRRKG
jgi:hypothetical protein